jgi:hypothetical protein
MERALACGHVRGRLSAARMTAWLEQDRHAAGDAAEADDPPRLAPARRCKALEGGADGTPAVLYIFYSVDPVLTRRLLGGLPRPALRTPGKGWRNARDLRPGDLLQLAQGDIAVVDKLVAAPGIDALRDWRVERMRTWVVTQDGTWKRGD